MKFATFAHQGIDRLGVLVDSESVLDLSQMGAICRELGIDRPSEGDLPGDMVSLIEEAAWAIPAIEDLREQMQHRGVPMGVLPLKSVRLLAPILRLRKNVFCVGRNYLKHAQEGAAARGEEFQPPPAPEFFTKPPTSVIGPNDEIAYDSRVTAHLDYEAELAVVIGRRGKNIPRDRAYDYVFGYTIVNDVTGRDLQRLHGQWFKGKALDGCCPMGPAVVHKSAVRDPHNLRIALRLNGETMQDASTGDMTFDIPTLIESLSLGMTLEPGDVISTGTPPGVGYARTPPVYLKPDDEVEAEVEGIGVLRNRVGGDANPAG